MDIYRATISVMIRGGSVASGEHRLLGSMAMSGAAQPHVNYMCEPPSQTCSKVGKV